MTSHPVTSLTRTPPPLNT